MAWNVSQPDEGAANASSTAYTSGSFTPGANRPLVAFIFRSNDASISGITGHDGGGSWVQVFEETGIPSSQNRDIEIWACFTGSSPSAGSVVVSKSGYTWRCLVNIVEIDETVNGVDMSGTVANAFGVNGVDLGGYDVSPHQVTLGAFADSSNLTVVSAYAEAEAPSWGFEGAYTSLTLNAVSASIQVAYLGSEDNTVDVTGAGNQDQGIHAFEVKQGVSLVLEQEGFRWRDDDDSETAATWLASQDVDITRAKETNTRLRILLNATGDPAATQYKLQYKKTSDGTWRDMPTS